MKEIPSNKPSSDSQLANRLILAALVIITIATQMVVRNESKWLANEAARQIRDLEAQTEQLKAKLNEISTDLQDIKSSCSRAHY